MEGTKICPSCAALLPLSSFSFRDKKKSRTQSYCKECANKAWREWYSEPSNKERHLKTLAKRRARRIERNKALVLELKSEPCADCGNTFPPEAMDFDHLHQKEALVSKLVYTVSTSRLVAEIDKCEVVCSNCHRVRTSRRLRKRTS